MYTTKNTNKEFAWDQYFSKDNGVRNNTNKENVLESIGIHLKENKFDFGIIFTKLMRKALEGSGLTDNLSVLELGAGSGYTTSWLLNFYGGNGVLIDNNETSYQYFLKQKQSVFPNIEYIKEDIFKLQLESSFDIVCSFGLIEHFENKKEIIDAHKKYLNRDGYLILIVPTDTILSRIYWDYNTELDLGYRELVTEEEFLNTLENEGLEVIKMCTSEGYVYDFTVALCKL